MKGRSVVEATLDGAGPVSEAARALHELEHALADPARADEMESAGRALRRGAGALRGARRLRARRARARGARRARLRGRADGRRRRRALRRLEDARRARAHPRDAARRAAARRADQPPRPRVDPLARGLAAGLRGRAGDDLPRPRVPEPPGLEDRSRSTAASSSTYSGDYDFYERQRALAEREQEAQYARQQAMLAKEEAFIARFKARASHAAQVQSRVKKLEKIERVEPPKRRQVVEFEFRPAPRSGDDVVKLAGVTKAYGERTSSSTGLDLVVRRRRALVRDGRERRRQVDAAQAGRRRPSCPTPAP